MGGGTQHLISKMLETVYPVGSIYISTSSTSPASLYGGEWERYGKGRTLVAVDEADSDFSSVGKTGGEKVHTLLSNEIPDIYPKKNQEVYQNTSVDYGIRFVIAGLVSGEDSRHIGAGAISINNGNKAHNNLQPYISVYMWRRTN